MDAIKAELPPWLGFSNAGNLIDKHGKQTILHPDQFRNAGLALIKEAEDVSYPHDVEMSQWTHAQRIQARVHQLQQALKAK